MSKSISQIKDELSNAESEQLRRLLEEYRQDSRIGVKKIIEKHDRDARNLSLELIRIKEMNVYELKYKEYISICGIDEVGRGPLAGPVVAGAVILDKNIQILYLNDSKQLSEKKREILYDEIMEKAIAVGIGVVPPGIIDEINILQATYLAMRKAISNLSVKPDILLNDAVKIPEVKIRQIPIVKGDEKSVSIAAASIIAKVERDRMMKEYDKIYPEYQFEKNKGYGTAEHIHTLYNYGPCPIHRQSFIKNFI